MGVPGFPYTPQIRGARREVSNAVHNKSNRSGASTTMEMHFLSDDATPRIDTNLEKECGFFQRNFESKFGTPGVGRVSLELGGSNCSWSNDCLMRGVCTE